MDVKICFYNMSRWWRADTLCTIRWSARCLDNAGALHVCLEEIFLFSDSDVGVIVYVMKLCSTDVIRTLAEVAARSLLYSITTAAPKRCLSGREKRAHLPFSTCVLLAEGCGLHQQPWVQRCGMPASQRPAIYAVWCGIRGGWIVRFERRGQRHRMRRTRGWGL